MRNLVCTALLLVLAAGVIYPIYLLVLDSFAVPVPGGGTRLALDHWRLAWGVKGVSASIVNTAAMVGVTTAISLPIAIVLAWLNTRTDVPGKRFLTACAWIAFFLPTVPVVMGWILLLDPDYGLVNMTLMRWFGLKNPPFDIYSFWGIVFAHLLTKSIAVKYIFLLPAFRKLSAALEESSRVCGGGAFYTLRHVVIPVLAPAILITSAVALFNALESFEVELVLGTPWGFQVFSTKIYTLIRAETPDFGTATVLALGILAVIVPLIVLQRIYVSGHSYATQSGGFRVGVTKLRAWRWPIFALLALYALALTLVPLTLLLLGSVMRVFGYFNVANAYTLANWRSVLGDQVFLNAVSNTLILGAGAAIFGTVLAAVAAYVAVRTRYAGRSLLDFVTWIPACIPGVILSLGLLEMFLRVPLFRPFYGTIVILIVAALFASATSGVQLVKSNMIQLGVDLEEASTVAGGSWFYTLRHVVLPLLRGTLLSVGILTFAAATRNVANIAMLVSNQNRPLAMLQLDYVADGTNESAAIIGVITVLITCGVALAAFALGGRRLQG